MKLDSLFVLLTLLLASGGGLLSYYGYSQSLEMLPTVETYTTTSPYVSTSQMVVTNIESYTATSISKFTIVDEDARLARWQTDAFIGCGYALRYTRTLQHNPLHISYSVQKEHRPVVHFFLMQAFVSYPPYVIQPTYGGCGADLIYAHNIIFTTDTATFDGEINVNEAGEYEILLLVQEGAVPGEEILTTIRIEQTDTTVKTVSQTTTATTNVAYNVVKVLEISSTSFQLAGLGLTYYAGIGALVAGAVLASVTLLRNHAMMGPGDQLSQRERREGQESSESCRHCGAKITRDGMFCEECGAKQ